MQNVHQQIYTQIRVIKYPEKRKIISVENVVGDRVRRRADICMERAKKKSQSEWTESWRTYICVDVQKRKRWKQRVFVFVSVCVYGILNWLIIVSKLKSGICWGAYVIYAKWKWFRVETLRATDCCCQNERKKMDVRFSHTVQKVSLMYATRFVVNTFGWRLNDAMMCERKHNWTLDMT